MSKVIVRKVDGNLQELVDQIFDQFAPDLNHRKVLVKPNMVSAVAGDSGIVTHPEVITAVVRAARARGAEVAVGDNPGGVDTSSFRTAQKAGVVDAAEGAFVNLSDQVVEVPANCKYTDTFVISKRVLEADYIINVPVFKSHVLTSISGSMKNLYGYIAGSVKAKLHLKAPSRRRFSELLADLYRIKPPDLNIIDALTVMDGDGPGARGRVRPFGYIMGSSDAVALDATMARMVGIDPSSLPLLAIGHERGYGTMNADEIEVIGELPIVPDYVVPTTFWHSVEEQVSMLTEISLATPEVNQDQCIMCEDCATNCPAQVIAMNPYPEIDAANCIACYCCVELCPEGAMAVPAQQKQIMMEKFFG